MRYRGREFSEGEISQLKKILSVNAAYSRLQQSRRICEELNWRRADGKLKDMACRVALLQMEKDGIIILPPLTQKYRGGKMALTRTLEGEPQSEIRCRAGDLVNITLEIAKNKQDKQLWSELVDRYHYLGYKPLGGAQLRYLIRSEDRILGCLGWCAAAWKTAPRDQFIGWTHAEREKNLEKIVNNARFLILPWVNVHSLASKALSMATKRLPEDWQKHYGYRPVLMETFVEKERFLGTCYKAANWIHVGETKGRGRYDRYSKYSQPIKTIWLYPLTQNFRKELCG